MTTSVEGVDDKTRTLYFTAAGREKGEDPYYTAPLSRRLRRHRAQAAERRRRLARRASYRSRTATSSTNSSRVDSGAGVHALRHAGQRCSLKLETPDLSALKEMGFKFPEPFTVKADDGITDLYGVMYKPFDFDPSEEVSDHRLRLSRVRRPRA